MKTASRILFKVGDYALEIEPMREHGGAASAEGPFTVKESLFRLSEDIGMSYYTVKQARQTASKWPEDRRVAEVSFTVHNILASIADDEERFAAILTPPPGRSRWTPDEAKRRTGRQVANPVTPQEKIGITDHLGGDHHHDQAHHSPKLPQERTAGLPRNSPRLIISKDSVITLPLTPGMTQIRQKPATG
ncbi:DUF6192 family protein [Streptomyces sp. NPDC058464]|uniref:DUF6192 family protein n=1 Tax=Streptomyces sp. NPDC058464 TaxID=3346511 RepID=UPI003662650B